MPFNPLNVFHSLFLSLRRPVMSVIITSKKNKEVRFLPRRTPSVSFISPLWSQLKCRTWPTLTNKKYPINRWTNATCSRIGLFFNDAKDMTQIAVKRWQLLVLYKFACMTVGFFFVQFCHQQFRPLKRTCSMITDKNSRQFLRFVNTRLSSGGPLLYPGLLSKKGEKNVSLLVPSIECRPVLRNVSPRQLFIF